MCRSSCCGRGLTLGVQQTGEAQVLLCQVESVLQVVVSVGFFQFFKVDQIRPEKNV